MRLHNFFSLPHLLTRCTRGREPLIDYSQSHVVTFIKYVNIPRKKNMDMATTEEIIKEKEKKKRINEPKE